MAGSSQHAAIVGSLNIDLVTRAAQLPNPGETVFGSSFVKGFGGKGANQAVIFSRLAGPKCVSFVGAVGDDSFGHEYITYLKDIGIQTEDISICKTASTGCAPIWVDEKSGENRIIVVPGANMHVQPSAVSSWIGERRLASRMLAVVCQNEINMDATAAALMAGAEAGALTVWTPAPVPHGAIPPGLLANVSVLVPNLHEASALLGKQLDMGDDSDPVPTARHATLALLGQGCHAVIVTLGSKGCLVATGGEAVHVPACEVTRVVDTTGAGDAFSGSLAFFILLLAGASSSPGSPFQPSLEMLLEAASRASYVAAHSVTKEGTQSSYPAKDELPAVLFDVAARGAATTAAQEKPL